MLVDTFKNFDTGAEDPFFFSQMVEKFINLPNSWLLLYSELSTDVISNKAMATNIQRSPKPITRNCNSGLWQVEYTTDLNRYGRVWCYPKAISNILSLYHATSKYQAVFISEDRNCFRLMLLGRGVVLNVSTNRLYFHDTVDRAIVLTNIVEENREGFTHQE